MRPAVKLALSALIIAAASSGADPAAGQKLFAACSVCHDVGAANKQGPGLGGIVGRKAGTAPGFRYSGAMRRAKFVWTAGKLDAYLADPQGLVPGNTMPFPGLPDPRQRQDLILYLKELKGRFEK